MVAAGSGGTATVNRTSTAETASKSRSPKTFSSGGARDTRIVAGTPRGSAPPRACVSAKARSASSAARATAVASLPVFEDASSGNTISMATSLKVKPAATPRLSSSVAATMSRADFGRMSKASLNAAASSSASSWAICAFNGSQTGALNAGQSIQHQSNHSMDSTSGKQNPWSMGTSFRSCSFLPAPRRCLGMSKFAALRSQLRQRMSRAAMACNLCVSKRPGAKSSATPECGT